ncbi:MAG TPA: S1/P1 nuclease [Longimicrobiales bacterium]
MRHFTRIATLALLLLPARAFAWGEEGHRTVCAIAWQRLTPQAHTMIARLLGADDKTTFVEACLWADQIRPNVPSTAPYHFVNIPAGASGFDMARDCADSKKHCVTWAIVHYANILADTSRSPNARRNALRFIGHFVGDVHQPLHAGRPEDLGGNRVLVDFFGNAGSGDRRMNLHSVWDTQILRHARWQWAAAALRLNAEVVPDEAQQWQTLDVGAWTTESYRVCEDYVYTRLPQNGKIRNAYYRPALGYVEVQLQKAGVRLAFLLNSAAGGSLVLKPAV